MKWTVTMKGWFGLCPVWLDMDGHCPIPRPLWLSWWFECNLWIIQQVNFWISIMAPALEVGFTFHHCEPVEPFEIEI